MPSGGGFMTASNVVSLADVRDARRPRRPCRHCQLFPCACSYIAKFEPGGELHWLYPHARREAAKPLPHRAACPCPHCYSARLATWAKEVS
jgi:hypothetical protein